MVISNYLMEKTKTTRNLCMSRVCTKTRSRTYYTSRAMLWMATNIWSPAVNSHILLWRCLKSTHKIARSLCFPRQARKWPMRWMDSMLWPSILYAMKCLPRAPATLWEATRRMWRKRWHPCRYGSWMNILYITRRHRPRVPWRDRRQMFRLSVHSKIYRSMVELYLSLGWMETISLLGAKIMRLR